ncbi:4-hydroxybenzoyl-CoA thioesterase [Iodidimonas nitroreducens]|uniref:4-hydroxybenzoyl-CoA thioesterase n=1 Tax=Iodidimonas nitroreducens TaxID=1236968 RepID=A0A5A7NAL8_9PROT|nr:hotdog domain-containing protein [Iodidimonas nitroreducens]GAK32698.1 putative protein [alpha proteobacterium Q-1]GER04967.1 4-hydroxybenzoyl-CoA thioesterase [Iodidimonas nitroreducens]
MNAPGPESGYLDAGAHYLPLRVYYEDTDAGGIVYHANYLRYFERARGEMLRLLGIDHIAAWLGSRDGPGSEPADGPRMGFAVRHVSVDYLRPARLDDALMVRSTVLHVGAAYVDAGQSIWRADDHLVSARLRVALVNDQGLPCRLPKAWRRILKTLEGVSPSEEASGF